MNVSFKEICRASVAEEWSRAGERVERSFLKEGSCFKMKTRGKGMKLCGKPEQNNTQKGFEELATA